MAKSKKTERIVVKNALRLLAIDEILFDTSYQRGIVSNSQKIADNYDPVAFGIPLVGEREDGTKWCVDGQQRINALKIRNENQKSAQPHKWVRCEVFASKGPEHEAAIFKIVNKDRIALQPLQLYQAMLTAGDEQAWAVKRVIERCGFKVPAGGKANADRNSENAAKFVTAINTCILVYERGGEEGLEFVLSTLQKVWETDHLRVKNHIIHGMYLFWKNCNKVVDLDRLIPRLQTTTPSKILYTASLGVSNASGNVADTIAKVYRKRLAK